MSEFARAFDYPERFEHEKVTRIMPSDLKKIGAYTLRMMMPPNTVPFAMEFVSIVTDVGVEDNTYDVTYFIKPDDNANGQFMGSDFNENGFMVIYNDGTISDAPDEIEMAYFVGSLDPFDLEFGALVEEAKKELENSANL